MRLFFRSHSDYARKVDRGNYEQDRSYCAATRGCLIAFSRLSVQGEQHANAAPPFGHATRFPFDFDAFVCTLASANCWSSSPLRTAAIKVSITDGSLSSDGTAIAAFSFLNSIGFNPLRRRRCNLVRRLVASVAQFDAAVRKLLL
jgi:hypothetical protein